MFGTLGGGELLLILIIALIVFGPRKLPEIGKSVGKLMAEFRRASNDFKRTIEDEVEAERVRETTPRPKPEALPPASEAVAPAPTAGPPEGTVAQHDPASAPAAPAPASPGPEAPTPIEPK